MEINHEYLFHVLPDPVVVIDHAAIVVASNAAATDFFSLLKPGANLNEWFVDKHQLKSILLQLMQYRRQISKIVYLKTSPDNVSAFILKFTILSDTNQLFVLTISDLRASKQLIINESQRLIKDEFGKLNPYLNKTGKGILSQKLSERALKPLVEVSFNKQFDKVKLHKLCAKFDAIGIVLTDSELELCYCIQLMLTSKQMANVLGKSTNAVRVQQFRLMKRTNFQTVKELKSFVHTQT